MKKNTAGRFPICYLPVITCALCLSACANIEFQKITDANRNSARGVRYWRPAPYLVVSAGPNQTCFGTIIYLPDPSEEYVMTPTPGFGTVAFKPSLADGWNLTSVDASIDSKAAEGFGVLGTAVPALVQGARQPMPDTALNPGMYRIRMDRNSGGLALENGLYRAHDAACQSFAYGTPPAPKGESKN